MTLSSLRALTRKALTILAKKHQIAGWNEMTKDELAAALAVRLRRRTRAGRSTTRRRQESTAMEASPLRENGREFSDRSTKAASRALGGGHLNGRRLLKPSMVATAPSDVRDVLTAEGRDPDLLDRCAVDSFPQHACPCGSLVLAMQWHMLSHLKGL